MTTLIVDVLLALLAVCLTIPCLVMLVECLAATPDREPVTMPAGHRPRIAILVPAHNEEIVIHDTVANLRACLDPIDRLLVVADNCTDRTAELAHLAGAEVVCRSAPELEGKGYALAFGIESLSQSPPDAVVLVDADCRVEDGGIERLALRAVQSGRPVQAEYVLRPQGEAEPRTAISYLALMVRNRVRPRGLNRLRLPCPLTGSGMAFPWALLRKAPALGANLVEDMVLGIELALFGAPPIACSTVAVTSYLPLGMHAQMNQRRRWESGHLGALCAYGPRLLWAGLVKNRLDLIAMAFDLMVPPLALLAMLLTCASVVSLLHAALGGSIAPLLTLIGATVGLSVAVFVAWRRFAFDVLPLATLSRIPLYVAWKFPLYAAYLFRRKPRRWERTTRA